MFVERIFAGVAKKGQARRGGRDLVYFVSAYKWHLDAARYTIAVELVPAQAREVIAQVLDNDGYEYFTVADPKYTTQNPETRELSACRSRQP